jgi:proteasome accessory factor A
MIDTLIPFFVTRQIFSGAGKLLQTARGTVFSLAQRAEHIWEGVSSATTRSRPIINTRDEPHADAERYRRLHVIVGDSNMSEYVSYVKVGATVALLQMLEDDVVFRDLSLENPIRAIREISHDTTCRRRVRLANGRELSALDIQWEYLERVMRYARAPGFPAQVQSAVAMWEHLLTGLEKDPMSSIVRGLGDGPLIEQYRAKHDLPMSSARLSLLDLAYHGVTDRGCTTCWSAAVSPRGW